MAWALVKLVHLDCRGTAKVTNLEREVLAVSPSLLGVPASEFRTAPGLLGEVT
jgi:hypothetical protein